MLPNQTRSQYLLFSLDKAYSPSRALEPLLRQKKMRTELAANL